MGSRKDLIIYNAKKEAQQWTVTDIDTMFTRSYDFNEHKVIFENRNEYSHNYKFSQMYNFENAESWLQHCTQGKPNYDRMYGYVQLQKDDLKQVTCRLNDNYEQVEIINMGYDNGANNCSLFPTHKLFCNEELLPSVELEKLDDPFVASDDSRDKDYIPEPGSDEIALADETVNSDFFQHCEFEDCNDNAISCCTKCHCLLCLVHFDYLMKFDNCNKHEAYSTENTFKDLISIKETLINSKENELSLLNVQERNTYVQSQQHDSYKQSRCEFENCDDEIFSTCGKCLCFLCFNHFEMEGTYTDCKKHILSSTSTKKYTESKKPHKVSKQKKSKVHDKLEATKKVSEEQTKDKGLTKKGNPRKRRKAEETLVERKEKRSKIEVEKLTLKDPCTESCRKKCAEKIYYERRKEINAEYVSMSWELKGCFIKSLVESKKVACRKTTNTEIQKRDVTYNYYFYNEQTKIEVCKTFFLATYTTTQPKK